MSLLNTVLFHLKNNRGRVTSPLAHILVSPLNPKFIASYPRSGSTWLRTMITNVIDPHANSNPDIFNKMIPGTTLTRIWHAYRSPQPRLLSTHSVYRRSSNRVVYVLRDGRDSLLSLYRYTTIRNGINMDFDNWFILYLKGWYGPRWDEHVEGWLTRGCEELKENMLVIRYEDCCNDPSGNLSQVCDFLEIRHKSNDISRAVELSAIDNMRKWERKLCGPIINENASFYRGKKEASEWLTLLNERQRSEFNSKSENALLLGGYVYER